MHLPPFLVLRADALGPSYTAAPSQDPKPQPPPPTDPGLAGPVPRDTKPGVQQTADQGAARAPGGQCIDPQSLLLMAAMFAVFYFLLIRPQQKQEKVRREMVGKADRGDRVVTSGGIHGTIVSGDKDTVSLRIDADVKIKIDRAAIARVIHDTPAGKDDGPKEGGSRKS